MQKLQNPAQRAMVSAEYSAALATHPVCKGMNNSDQVCAATTTEQLSRTQKQELNNAFYPDKRIIK